MYERPATEYVARFLGIRNALALTRENGWTTDAGRLEGHLQVLDRHKGPLRLFMRPQLLDLSAAGAAQLPPGHMAVHGGRVVDVLYSGSEVDYVVDVGGVSLFVTNPAGHSPCRAGDAVTVSFAGEHALLYANGVLVSG